MDNETKKMFEMLMNKLDNMEESQKEIKESQKEMKESQKVMEERQKNMEIRQDEIFSVVKAIEHSNTTHKAEIDNITYKVAHTEGTINKIGNVIIENRAIK
ncbi:MAG: M domain protein [Clostridium sp.]|uniref:M domain protein n=1 Tax=Clostridium sp. TaxID=1506 RepID=UPI003D6D7448